MPVESIEPLSKLLRNRFTEKLLLDTLISETKARQLIARTHSRFSLNAGDNPDAAQDVELRMRLAEYLRRAPFSLEKITLKETSPEVIYRSKRS